MHRVSVPQRRRVQPRKEGMGKSEQFSTLAILAFNCLARTSLFVHGHHAFRDDSRDLCRTSVVQNLRRAEVRKKESAVR